MVHKESNDFVLTPVADFPLHNIDDQLCIVVDDNISTVPQWQTLASLVADNLLGTAHAQGIQAIDLHFLHSQEWLKGVSESTRVREVFKKLKPTGNTSITLKMSQLLQACVSTFSIAPKWALSGVKTIKTMHYQVIAENLGSDDRRGVEQALSEASNWLTERGFPANQIGVSFLHFGWYSPFAREEFNILSVNLPRLGILNTIVSLAPDSFSEGPESEGVFISRAVHNLLELLSNNFTRSPNPTSNISSLLVEASQSPLPSPTLTPSSPRPRNKEPARPITLVDVRQAEIVDALDNNLPTEVDLDQAQSWVKILRPIITGKREPTDEDFALAIAALDDIDRLKSIISKSIIDDTGLLTTLRCLNQNSLSTMPEAEISSSRLWLARKATYLTMFFESLHRV